MSAGAQIDYDALAKQNGAISSQPAQVDYEALAKQNGAISSVPAQTQQQSQAGGGAANLGLSQQDIGTGPEGTLPELMSKASQTDATRKGLAVAGGIASAATGGIGGVAAQMGIQGAIGAATGATSAAADENAKKQDIINGALWGGATGAVAGGLGRLPGALAQTKTGRSFINQSVGATGRDVTYGNPAKALLNEGILTPSTGDIEAMKETGRMVDAGGRLGQVASKIQELQPQLNATLSKSTKTISMADAVDKPLMDAFNEITNNRAMTIGEKQAAVAQLGDLQQALHSGLGNDITPLEANQLKSQVGSRIRWTGTNQVGDEVKPAYKAIYASLRDKVNQAVPGISDLNDRLTDLHAANDDLLRLARNEEVGRGSGALGGTIGTTILGKLEKGAGRFIPSTIPLGRLVAPAATASIPALGSKLNPDITVSQ